VKVFISWSGVKARRVAVALKGFLQDVNQGTNVWFSDSDIAAGQRWGMELANQLDKSEFGIICVTYEALQSPWVLFEAGALGRSVQGGRVCPYLIDLTRRELAGPLTQFQAKEATKSQTWELVLAINFGMASGSLPEQRLEKYFITFWPALEAEISAVNRDIRALPLELHRQFMTIVPRALYDVREIEMLAAYSDLAVWEINWNQAAIHVWHEVLREALDHERLPELLDQIAERAPVLSERLASLRDWLVDDVKSIS
jgi:hypothetical protein